MAMSKKDSMKDYLKKFKPWKKKELAFLKMKKE